MLIDYDSLELSKFEMRRFCVASVGIGIITGLLFYDNILPGIAIGGVLFSFMPTYRRAMRDKRKNELRGQFRDMLYSISSSVAAGRSMADALEESVDFWKNTYEENDYIMQELRYMSRRIKKSNERDVDVLWDFAYRSALEDVADFVNVYENCRLSGANLPKAIDRATTIIGDKITLERELKTLMAQKVFESRIVIGAPFVLLFILKVTSPEYLSPLTETVSGRVVATFALLLMSTAVYMMERINRIEI